MAILDSPALIAVFFSGVAVTPEEQDEGSQMKTTNTSNSLAAKPDLSVKAPDLSSQVFTTPAMQFNKI